MQAHPGDAAMQQLGQLVINSVASGLRVQG